MAAGGYDGGVVMWQWADAPGQWRDYDNEASSQVEQHWRDWVAQTTAAAALGAPAAQSLMGGAVGGAGVPAASPASPGAAGAVPRPGVYAMTAGQPFFRTPTRYELDFTIMAQRNRHTRMERRVRRVYSPPEGLPGGSSSSGAFSSSSPSSAATQPGHNDHIAATQQQSAPESWAWLDDKGAWQAYEPATAVEVSALSRAAQADPALFAGTVLVLQHGSFFRSLPIGLYVVEWPALVQVNTGTHVVRPLCLLPGAGAAQAAQPHPAVRWLWRDDDGSMRPYSGLWAVQLERAHACGATAVDLCHGPYRVTLPADGSPMTQRNRNTGAIRSVVRQVLDLGGGANGGGGGGAAAAAMADDDDAGAAEAASAATPAPEGDELTRLGIAWTTIAPNADINQCPVCLDVLWAQAEEGDAAAAASSSNEPVVHLPNCGERHAFHRSCIIPVISRGSLKCPMCGVVYGQAPTGTQPRGRMEVSYDATPLPGFPSARTICIQYHFPDGVQGPEHPEPGAPYRGTTRTAYLPDTPEGRQVLALFRVAWERRLLFTVGQSITLGPAAGTRVTWNGIHHKTSHHGSHGFPDPTYFARVLGELADAGVTPADLNE